VLRDSFDANGDRIAADRIYYLTDANHNVTSLVNASGTVVERYYSSSYGQVTIITPDWTQTLRESVCGNTILFAGMDYDPSTELYYDRARWYNPATGTFLTRDPAAADVNVYRYCHNNPISSTDPTGLDEYYVFPLFSDIDTESLPIALHYYPVYSPSTPGPVAEHSATGRGAAWSKPASQFFDPSEYDSAQLTQAVMMGDSKLAQVLRHNATVGVFRLSGGLTTEEIKGNWGTTTTEDAPNLSGTGWWPSIRRTVGGVSVIGGAPLILKHPAIGFPYTSIFSQLASSLELTKLRISVSWMKAPVGLVLKTTTSPVRFATRWIPIAGWVLLLPDICEAIKFSLFYQDPNYNPDDYSLKPGGGFRGPGGVPTLR